MTDAQQPPAPTTFEISAKSPDDIATRLKDLSIDQLHALINTIEPKRETYAGTRFLHLLLDKLGVKKFLEYTDKLRVTLDKEGRLYDYDMGEHNDLLKRANPNLLDRRSFMNSAAWGVSGTVFTAWGLARTGEQTMEYLDPEPKKEDPLPPARSRREWLQRIFKKGQECIDTHLMGPADIVVGLALLHEAAKEWRELRMEEIANAIAELADKSPPERSGQSR